MAKKKFDVTVNITVSNTIEVEAESEDLAEAIVTNLLCDNSYAYVTETSGAHVEESFIVETCEAGPDKDSGEGESETVKEALDYVRDGLGEEDLTIYRLQVTKNMRNRQPAWDGVDDVRVMSLLEEYGEENGLSEGWWETYGDINDWLEKL